MLCPPWDWVDVHQALQQDTNTRYLRIHTYIDSNNRAVPRYQVLKGHISGTLSPVPQIKIYSASSVDYQKKRVAASMRPPHACVVVSADHHRRRCLLSSRLVMGSSHVLDPAALLVAHHAYCYRRSLLLQPSGSGAAFPNHLLSFQFVSDRSGSLHHGKSNGAVTNDDNSCLIIV